MKTYVLTEADQATGCGQVHLELTQDPYLCLHKVAGGSTEIIEYVAQPVTHGVNKRFNIRMKQQKSSWLARKNSSPSCRKQ